MLTDSAAARQAARELLQAMVNSPTCETVQIPQFNSRGELAGLRMENRYYIGRITAMQAELPEYAARAASALEAIIERCEELQKALRAKRSWSKEYLAATLNELQCLALQALAPDYGAKMSARRKDG